MALLNPPDMTPGVVRHVIESTNELGTRATKDNLVRYCAPGDLGGPESRTVATSLNAALMLGLVEEDDGTVRVSDLAAKALDRDGSARTRWPEFLTRTILTHESAPESVLARSEASDDARTAGVRDLLYALTWFLSQDAFGRPFAWKPGDGTQSLQQLQHTQLGPDRERWALINDTRPAPLARWAIAMGLAARPAVGDSSAFTPNPAQAVRRVVKSMIASGDLGDGMPIDRFAERVSADLPMMWPGSFRGQLSEMIGRDPDPDVGDGEGVDSSLGLALLTLRTEQLIRVEDRADSTTRLLIGRASDSPVRVTHISAVRRKA